MEIISLINRTHDYLFYLSHYGAFRLLNHGPFLFLYLRGFGLGLPLFYLILLPLVFNFLSYHFPSFSLSTLLCSALFGCVLFLVRSACAFILLLRRRRRALSGVVVNRLV